MLSGLYDRCKALAGHRRAVPVMAGVSFIESSVFPIPPDVMLIPMVVARPKRWWWLALVCTIASVLGGIFGYVLGMFFFDALARPALEWLGKMEAYEQFKVWFLEYEALAVFGAALTPFPFKVITIASGALKINFAMFVAACVIGRSIRFFLVAGLTRWMGPAVEPFIRKHFAAVTIVLFVLGAAVYYLMH